MIQKYKAIGNHSSISVNSIYTLAVSWPLRFGSMTANTSQYVQLKSTRTQSGRPEGGYLDLTYLVQLYEMLRA